jgi:two-component system phosphate regulon response regulator OmpR
MASVWLVDDEPQWLELLRHALADEGHDVRTYTDGRRMIRQLDAERPEVLILDVQMSPSGAEVLAAVRSLCPRLPVLMNSSCPACRRRPELAAATCLVVKNTDPGPLLAAVDRALSGL